jgi:hypothetical protein
VKIALCTTTIHIPHALKLMRKCSPDVRFFVAMDKKTPAEAVTMVRSLGGWCDHGHSLSDDYRISKVWKCSEAIGWNTLARRNIAFLEALAWGADIIVSWDTDNMPMSSGYFDQFERTLTQPYNGLLGSHKSGWFDAGQMLVPWARHRGIPYDNVAMHAYDIATNYRVGVAAGLVLGNPDIDATTRMEKAPEIHNVSELARMGVLVDVNTHTVFNTQNTAMIRQLVPAWFLMPGVGRHDDLYASLIVQRVARERGLHVHFGLPFVWQERHAHDQLVDLKAEIDGMTNIRAMADLLDAIILPGKSVIEDMRVIYQTLEHAEWIPDKAIYAAYKWLEDCEGLVL